MKSINDEKLLDEILFDLDCFQESQNRLTEGTYKELEEYFGRINSAE